MSETDGVWPFARPHYWDDSEATFRALLRREWLAVKQSHFDRAIARQRLRKERRHWNRR